MAGGLELEQPIERDGLRLFRSVTSVDEIAPRAGKTDWSPKEQVFPRTETLLYQAARAQIVEQVIRPRLAAGEIVLSDRYADSTIAYQGYGHQQDLEQVRALIKYATGGLVPDLTILLDVDVEVGLKRKKKGDEWNRMDAYTVEFHQRVRNGYLEMVKRDPVRWVVVDAGREWPAVQEELRRTILERIEIHHG